MEGLCGGFYDGNRVGIELAKKAVTSDSDNHSFMKTLGAAYYRAGKFDEAIEILKQEMAIEGNGARTTRGNG